MKTLRSLPFRYRILLACLLVSLVPLLLYNFILLTVLQSRLELQAREEAQWQLTEMNRQMDEMWLACDAICTRISQDELLLRSMIDNTASQTDVYLALYRAGGGLPSGAGISLYDSGGLLRFTTDSVTAEPILPTRWGVLYKAKHAEGTVYYNIENFFGSNPAYAMHIARAMRSENGALMGYAVVSLADEQLRSLFAGTYDGRSAAILLDATGNLVYTTHAGAEDDLPMLRNWLLSGKGSRLARVDDEYQYRRNPASGYYLLHWMPKTFSADTIRTMQTINLLMALLSLTLCLLVALPIGRGLSRPINRLNAAMELVKEGQLDTRVEVRSKDELGQLAQSFNKMTEDLQEYMNRTIRHQQEQNETQTRLLQAQLNPHFLYNTLDTIKWLAKINKVPQIATITSNLAVILRQCVSYEQQIPLWQECAMVQSYVDIQRIRFSGKFQFVCNIPPELADCMIPKLILQPLVENAILHGLQDKENGYVYVTAVAQQNDLLVSVTDDGCGMPQSAVDRLNNGESKLVEGHLGLYNVGSILKFNYGPQYGLRAKSIPGIGTTVTVCLPIQRREEDA